MRFAVMSSFFCIALSIGVLAGASLGELPRPIRWAVCSIVALVVGGYGIERFWTVVYW